MQAAMSTDTDIGPRPTGQASRISEHYQPLPPAAEAANLNPFARRPQAELDRLMSSIAAICRYFHKLELIPPFGERPPDKLLNELRKDADAAFWLPDWLREQARIAERDDCPPDFRRRYRNFPWWLPVHAKVIVIVPREDALGRLATLAWKLHAIEFAFNRFWADACDVMDMEDFAIRYGLQPWHRTRRMNSFGASIYWTEKRKPGINLAAYADQPCYHLEARVLGARALRSKSIGLYSPADLPRFDDARHKAFWKVYERYDVVDLERFGLWVSNRKYKEKRQKPYIRDFGDRHPTISINLDFRRGDTMWRVFTNHPNLRHDSTQVFLDAVGEWEKEVKDTIFHGKARADRPWLIPLTLF